MEESMYGMISILSIRHSTRVIWCFCMTAKFESPGEDHNAMHWPGPSMVTEIWEFGVVNNLVQLDVTLCEGWVK